MNMKVALLLAIIGYMMPLASARDMRVVDISGSAAANDAEFETDQRSLIAGEAAATSSSSQTYEKDSVRALRENQSRTSKSGKSTANKSGKSKSGKSKCVDTPHKIFVKSNKAGKSGNSNKAGKSGDSNKAGKPNVNGPSHNAGESKSSKGNICHHESENLLPTTNSTDLPSTNSTDLPNTNITDPDSDPSPRSMSPTPQPTCNPFDDFNICIAIDGSGSVCSTNGKRDCLGCSPPAFCQDVGIDRDTCCTNFANVKEFSSLMVTSLEELPVEKSFSVVQFATDATVEGELSSVDETLLTLDNMEYSGGATNHASAIQKCQQTFSPTSGNRKKFIKQNGRNRKQFILLVTDGASSLPKPDPEGTAEAAAALAKEDDIAIIPIFISSTYDEDALDFMRRLSSDGKVFDVTDFESLDSVEESLVNQVLCQ